VSAKLSAAVIVAVVDVESGIPRCKFALLLTRARVRLIAKHWRVGSVARASSAVVSRIKADACAAITPAL